MASAHSLAGRAATGRSDSGRAPTGHSDSVRASAAHSDASQAGAGRSDSAHVATGHSQAGHAATGQSHSDAGPATTELSRAALATAGHMEAGRVATGHSEAVNSAAGHASGTSVTTRSNTQTSKHSSVQGGTTTGGSELSQKKVVDYDAIRLLSAGTRTNHRPAAAIQSIQGYPEPSPEPSPVSAGARAAVQSKHGSHEWITSNTVGRVNRGSPSSHPPAHAHTNFGRSPGHVVSPAAPTGATTITANEITSTADDTEFASHNGTRNSNESGKDGAYHRVQDVDDSANEPSKEICTPPGKSALEVSSVLPEVAPCLKCLDKYHSEDAVEERTRACALQKLGGKNGALGMLADFLARSSLTAAAGLKLGGRKDAFKQATKILKKWRENGPADKSLSKVATMLPGLDLVGFGLYMNAGAYAKALRCITKTLNVEIVAQSISLILKPEMQQLSLVDIQAQGFQIQPSPHAGLSGAGLFDMFKNMVDVDGDGERRNLRKRGCFGPQRGYEASKDGILKIINEVLSGYVEQQLELEQVPTTIAEQCAATANSMLQEYRQANPFARQYLPVPKEITMPSQNLLEAVKQALGAAKLVHRPLHRPIMVPPDERPRWSASRGVPEAAASVSCLSFMGCLAIGTHTGVLGCIAGCVAGVGQLQRTVRRRAVPALNEWNAEAYEQATMSSDDYIAGDADIASVTEGTEEWNKAARSQSAAKTGTGFDTPDARHQTEVTTRTSARSAKGYHTKYRTAASSRDATRLDDASLRAGSPMGVVFEIPRAYVAPAAKLLREHLLFEVLKKQRPLRGWLLQLIEAPLLSYIAGLMFPRGQPLPLTVAVEVPEVKLEIGQTSIHTPRFTCMLVLELRLAYRGPNISKVHMAVTDEQLEKVQSALSSQLPDLDLRLLDSRLGGFTQPIGLEGNLHLSWLECDLPKLEMQDVKINLHLPAQ